MICERCKRQATNSARVCPYCGAPLRQYDPPVSAADIRQGRSHTPPAVYGADANRAPREERYAQDAGRPDNRRGVAAPGDPQGRSVSKRNDAPRKVRRRGFNRALLVLILVAVGLVAAVGLLVLGLRRPEGHLLLLRATLDDESKQERVISLIGEENGAIALWQIGDDLLNQGYVDRAISVYRRAYALNPEIDGLYDRLLSLADAYEAVGYLDEAEAVYQQLYTQVDPRDPRAYRYTINIMLDQGRVFEATTLMQAAYQQTAELSFKSQREQLVPLPPTTDTETGAGSYWIEKDIALFSSQGYDIYYLLDDAESELPEKGIEYTAPIRLGEGTHEIRAVCVSSQLVSDEVSLRYTIRFPVPKAPKSRLLTGEYQSARRIYLYMEPDEPGALKQEYTIYYTIDGTAPNSDSPIYTDEGFVLKLGKYTVRAVAVNQYGKVSNEYVGTYTISGAIREKYFRDTTDQFKAFTLGKTTYSDFKKTYGPGREEMIEAEGTYSGQAMRVTYDWGTACFSELEQVLYAVSTSYASMTAPRGSHVGMKLAEVTALFRDMGQVANAKGDRSIYYAADAGYARYYHDTETLVYVYWREDGGTCTLTYLLRDGAVYRIEMGLADVVLQ